MLALLFFFFWLKVFFWPLRRHWRVQMKVLKNNHDKIKYPNVAELSQLRPGTRPLSHSVGAAYPIIREAVVCVERGLRQVNNPQPF